MTLMKDYFTYLPRPREPSAWGVTVTGSGLTHIPPGGAYPPERFRHPSDHMFTWEAGRVLDMWQALLIHEGEGWFESRPTGLRRCRAGTVFILFPGVWHRYRPDPKTGWTDSYIEWTGATPDGLRERGLLQPKQAVFGFGPQPELTGLFERMHEIAQDRPTGYAGLLSTLALQIMATLLSLSETASGAPRRIQTLVRRAQSLLAERYDRPPRMSALARELGVGYSYFRRAFRKQTGISPKQYAAQLRFRRAQSMLRATSLTIKEIAEALGYNSAYHFSAEFKRMIGTPPSLWRARPADGLRTRPTPGCASR